MTFTDYIKLMKEKIEKANKTAKNPFIDENYAYNPFRSVFNRTYVWVEEDCPDDDTT